MSNRAVLANGYCQAQCAIETSTRIIRVVLVADFLDSGSPVLDIASVAVLGRTRHKVVLARPLLIIRDLLRYFGLCSRQLLVRLIISAAGLWLLRRRFIQWWRPQLLSIRAARHESF